MKAYEESLKVYRDNQNTMDYAISTAVRKRNFEIAKEMKKDGHAVEMIARYTGLTKEQIEKL